MPRELAEREGGQDERADVEGRDDGLREDGATTRRRRRLRAAHGYAHCAPTQLSPLLAPNRRHYPPAVDTYLAIASKRDQRRYADREIPEHLVQRILDAGRLSGSANNRQPWRFLVLESRDLVERLATMVYAPKNLLGATLVVAIVTPGGRRALDVGRAAQNMMLAAWNEGVTSCPNGLPDPDLAARELRLGEERPVLVLSFGYPAAERNPESRPAEEWSHRANRRPLDQLVQRL